VGVDVPHAAWRLHDAAGVALCAFDDAVVAFDLHAWETHIVDERAAIVLEALGQGPRTQDALAALLAFHARCDPSEVASVVRAALDELTAAGLVEGPAVDAPY
jgi:PqqD family protein of HPr-rel-A system